MKDPRIRVLSLFLLQVLIVNWGTNIFQKEANPFVLLLVTGMLCWYSLKLLAESEVPETTAPSPAYLPWLHSVVGMFGVFTAYEELRKIWKKYPNYELLSDVIPQLEAQCTWFFTGQFPYQNVTSISHSPFPVYMPLHWAPVQISNSLSIDTRWTSIIMFCAAVGIAGFWLSKSHSWAPKRLTIPSMLLFALPLWGFVLWGKTDLAVSLEGIVAAWYILLVAGLATKNHVLITIGLIGALMSRYTLIFWTIPFAVLLWLHAPKKYSFWIWGITVTACLGIFVIPFWMKDPSIISKIMAYYNGCASNSWLRPDEYTFREGLSLNIHLRRWLPGTPEENIGIMNLPQIVVQFVLAGIGIYFYEKKWAKYLDLYTYSLVLLTIMVLAMYSFSPMLFRYYMLMPMSISAVLCWKVLASKSNKPVLS